MSCNRKRELISPSFNQLSVKQQCTLLGLARSSYYFKPRGESPLNQRLMNIMDERFTKLPFTGVSRMTDHLNLDLGYYVNIKRVRRLYKVMALDTLLPKPNTSKRKKGEYIYPYLLNNLVIDKPNQVWQADITYVRMCRGFMYKFAIIDVFSRKLMGWSVSNTMSVEWCKEVVETAINEFGKPEIFNTDQGSQFTSPILTEYLKKEGIKISMDGKGRALDNIFIERYWRTYKYEFVYLNPPNGSWDLYYGTKKYVEYYNNERRHDSIGKCTPNEYYFKYRKLA
jgi:putative transposase